MIQQGACTIFKVNLASRLEDFTATSPYTYKIALYTANANLGPTTTAYTSDGEISGTGYTATGKPLTIIPVTSENSTVAYLSFDNVTWDPANFTARAALIYNSTTGAAVCVLDFGSDKTATNTFTVTFPAATPTAAVIRLN
jgi:hypothetical protein